MNSLSLQFGALNRQDYRVYGRVAGQHATSTRQGRRFTWLVFCSFVILSLPVAVYLARAPDPPFIELIVLVVLVVLAVLALRRYQVTQFIASQGEVVTVTLQEEGIRWDDEKFDSLTRWHAVAVCYEIGQNLIFVIDAFRFMLIPARAFENEAHFRECRFFVSGHVECVRELETPRWGIRVESSTGLLATIFVLLAMLVCLINPPWRESQHLPLLGEDITYYETVVGNAAPGDALPMVIAIHGYGSMPELDQILFHTQLDFPVRVIFPVGPHRNFLIGHRWDDWDESDPFEVLVSQYTHEVRRISALSRILVKRYNPPARPVITGFSQGGSISYAAAVLAPDDFMASLPLAGALVLNMQEHPHSGAMPVRAIHGTEDSIFPLEWARSARQSLAAAGMDVDLVEIGGMGHELNESARRQWRLWMREFVATSNGQQ